VYYVLIIARSIQTWSVSITRPSVPGLGMRLQCGLYWTCSQ